MSNAFGTLQFPALRKAVLGAGIQTELGQFVGPGSRVAAYVRASGPQSGDDPEIAGKLVSTLNAGLAQCRSGMGDIVLVMPGHAENVSSADYMSSLVAGTRIVGLGYGALRPTFTWTATAATWLFDVANVELRNCVLEAAGPSGTTAITVDAPITISASGCALIDCDIRCERDADQGATIAVTTTAAADDLTIAGCKFHGTNDGTLPTTYLRLVGADRLKLLNNVFTGASSSATIGLVQFITTASTDILMLNNWVFNSLATSNAAVTGLAGLTGFVNELYTQSLGAHANFAALGNANGNWSASAGSLSFGPDVYMSSAAGAAMIKTATVDS